MGLFGATLAVWDRLAYVLAPSVLRSLSLMACFITLGGALGALIDRPRHGATIGDLLGVLIEFFFPAQRARE